STVTTIEQLSIELWRDIFDYLMSCEIIAGFSGLNSRLNRLINSIPLFIDLSSNIFLTTYKNVCQSSLCHTGSILSLNLAEKHKVGAIDLFLSLTDIKQFINLQKLVIVKADHDNLSAIVFKLRHLKHLCTLKIDDDLFRNIEKDVIKKILTVKSLRRLDLSTISKKGYAYLKKSSIEQLTLKECDRNLIYYLPQSIKSLTVIKELSLLLTKPPYSPTTFSYPNLTHLKLTVHHFINHNDDINYLIISISHYAEYVSIQLLFTGNLLYYSGDFWAEYLSSLPFTCKIEIMVDTPVSDTNETHLNYIKQTFQVSNQFWIQHNLSVEFHYNKHTSRIYTLPYPKTKNEDYDLVRTLEIRTNENYSDRHFRKLKVLIFSLFGSCLPSMSGEWLSLLNKTVASSLPRLKKFVLENSFNDKIEIEIFLTEVLNRAPNLEALMIRHRDIFEKLMDVVSQMSHPRRIVRLELWTNLTLERAGELVRTLPKLQLLACEIDENDLQRVLPVVFEQMKHLVLLKIIVSHVSYDYSIIGTLLDDKRWTIDERNDSILVWM
ncbi:unnamed protein product, partial [Didymodactylos carnosus]